MFPLFRQQPLALAKRATTVVGLAVLMAGCGPPSPKQALEKVYKDNPKVKKVEIAPFEGTVTVDGKPGPKEGYRLFVILNDMAHPQDPSKLPALRTGVDESGHFAFTTFEKYDGVQVGSYVVTFVELEKAGGIRARDSILHGPDQLNNLYNDPDKNAQVPEFKVDIKKPDGIKDARFNLLVAGKEPVTTPGPHAITQLDFR